MVRKTFRAPLLALMSIIIGLVFSSGAEAVPSFARQTGMTCAICHTVFPQLTPFGRQFKLNGYVLSTEKSPQGAELPISPFPPISAMMLVSYNASAEQQPDTQNGNVLFPDQMSLFYAGRVDEKIGAFLQLTYTGADDHFSMDNGDIRFADTTSKAGGVTYGVTFNNNPTVQDLWNSTPAWGFPYVSSEVTPTPAAATQLDGTLGQQVAGLGAYGFWKNQLYAELSFYRSSQIGGPQPPDSSSENTIRGSAPYWRLAYEKNWGTHDLEVGTLGMNVDLFPGDGAPPSGPTDHYRDIGADLQYQYLGGKHTATIHALWLDEKQDLDASFARGASSNTSSSLRTFRLDATYYNARRLGGSLGYFSTTGDRNPVRYQTGEPVTNSRTGEPDSAGWIAALDFAPWLNDKFELQYIAYTKFNGASSNYDGFGRDAKDNNTIYLAGWFAF